MKKTKILYWVFTGLFAFVMLGSSIPDIWVIPQAVEGFKQIGLPAYLIPFLGWAKLFGVIAILTPGFPRIKEWAYAGLIFDLLGATYCVFSAGKATMDWSPMLIFVVLGFASYFFYHKKQEVASLTEHGNQKYPQVVLS
ncbi:hypothetical protein GCM10028803_52100 [Larkinella knui]|uniref:DoxX family protein n=1 Tax=Larkinella knui TaxID=2025310 RepID=A0A3P1CH35_9BACT|nr:DoxX family protein [Larkinella knui]RRB12577.1 DoxX family protein [Larkinella knui]